MSKPNDQYNEAMSDLMVAQVSLGKLGFTLTSENKYYKDYGDGDCIYRLIPIFDSGISVDVRRKLVGFNIVSSKFIPVANNKSVQMDDLPLDCIYDINKIVAELTPSAKSPLTETFIITQLCSMCDKDVPSYMFINGKYTCLKCLGVPDNTEDESSSM